MDKRIPHIQMKDSETTRCGLWVDDSEQLSYSVHSDRTVTPATAKRLIKKEKRVCVRCIRRL